jgi:hypothetical protein
VCEHPDSLIANIVTLSGISISSWKNPRHFAEKKTFINQQENIQCSLSRGFSAKQGFSF